MHALDTTPAAATVHEEAQRRLGPAGRLRSALELSHLTHAFAVAGIRRRHPDLSDADARAELARLLYVRRWPSAMLGEFLRKVTAALDTAGVPYMLTGSLASSMYGIPRATNDIDIVIAPTRQQLLDVIQFYKRMGLYVDEHALTALTRKTQFSVIDFPNGWKLDLIIRKDRDFSAAEFGRRETHEVEGMRLTIAAPEDVILAKMEWSKIGDSERQLIDAAGVLRMQRDTLNLGYIETWVDSLGLQEQWADVLRRAG